MHFHYSNNKRNYGHITHERYKHAHAPCELNNLSIKSVWLRTSVKMLTSYFQWQKNLKAKLGVKDRKNLLINISHHFFAISLMMHAISLLLKNEC